MALFCRANLLSDANAFLKSVSGVSYFLLQSSVLVCVRLGVESALQLLRQRVELLIQSGLSIRCRLAVFRQHIKRRRGLARLLGQILKRPLSRRQILHHARGVGVHLQRE